MTYKHDQILKKDKNKLFMIGVALLYALTLAMSFTFSAGADPLCEDVTTSKGSLTAAQVGGDVTGVLDATGCDIGAYFNFDNPGSVDGAEIHDANNYGVFVDGNVSGDLKVNVNDSSIYNIGFHNEFDQFAPNGGQTGVGVYYAGFDSPGTVMGQVSNNSIHEYQKAGFVANGSNSSVRVVSNDIAGFNDVPFIAQNGIQFGYGASGQARDNSVIGNWYTGANWASSGVLVFESDNVKIDGNTVSNSQIGIGLETWCYFGVPSASNNKVIGNTVVGSDWGISVAAYSFYSSCDAQANNNKVTNNVVESDGGETGIFVGAADIFGGYSPEAVNNKVIKNDVSGFASSYERDGDAATKMHANAF